MEYIQQVVHAFEDELELTTHLSQIIKQRREHEWPTSFYDCVEGPLIQAFSYYFGDDWTTELDEAWRGAIRHAHRKITSLDTGSGPGDAVATETAGVEAAKKKSAEEEPAPAADDSSTETAAAESEAGATDAEVAAPESRPDDASPVVSEEPAKEATEPKEVSVTREEPTEAVEEGAGEVAGSEGEADETAAAPANPPSQDHSEEESPMSPSTANLKAVEPVDLAVNLPVDIVLPPELVAQIQGAVKQQ